MCDWEAFDVTYMCLIAAGLVPSPWPVLGMSIEMPWEGTIPTLSSTAVSFLGLGGIDVERKGQTTHRQLQSSSMYR